MVHVVIGATGGIGSAVARRLRARGAAVHLVARDGARLAALAEEIGATRAVADVRDEAALREAITIAGSEIRGLVHAVGTLRLRPLARTEPDEVLEDVRVNAISAMVAAQAALPALKQAKGAMVLFSSIAVGQGFPGHVSIAMAKGAVEGLIRALAAELAPDVRVNGIAPSLTRTPLAAGLVENPAMAKAIADLHPLRRLGEPEDIAALADFLLGDEAAWITGQVIGVDGGRSSLRVKG